MPIKKSTVEDAKRFEYTATGILGLARETMLQNEIHQRFPVGKTQTRGRPKLPPNHTYGYKYPAQYNGVAKCMKWNYSEKPKTPDPSTFPRDYIKTNMEALKCGSRKTAMDANYKIIPQQPQYSYGGIRKEPHKFPTDMVFGIPVRPGTPIGEVISHQFQEDWMKEALSKNLLEMDRIKKEKTQILRPFDNLSSVFRCRYGINKNKHLPAIGSTAEDATALNGSESLLNLDSSEYCQCNAHISKKPIEYCQCKFDSITGKFIWQMPRFISKGEAQISSFRSEKALQMAYKRSIPQSVH